MRRFSGIKMESERKTDLVEEELVDEESDWEEDYYEDDYDEPEERKYCD